ncbi:MAG TPA: DNA gyrase inhibitor YacG [Nitrospiraceae bacterium]|nr:DNA gyrase inhibitor YacG [Nitrospiraceae bacterium]
MAARLHCPICRHPVTWENNPFRPFCSERCRTIDLGSWAAGWYRIPGQPLTVDSDTDEKAESEPPPPESRD